MTHFSDQVREHMNDPDHGIRHNGNDHARGPLRNCPRCVAEELLAECDRLREDYHREVKESNYWAEEAVRLREALTLLWEAVKQHNMKKALTIYEQAFEGSEGA